MNPFLKIRGLVLCVLAVALFLLSIWPAKEYLPTIAPISEDLFDPILVGRVQSVDQLLNYTDSIAHAKQIPLKSAAYWDEMATVLRYRFYHGYANYDLSENWIAFLSGQLFWYHLKAIVIPDDILKHPMAACSQQSIVLMECMKRRGVPFRAVKFARHYAVEAQIDGGWKYFDTNLEPILSVPRQSFETYYSTGEWERMYAHRIEPLRSAFVLKFTGYSEESVAPAPNATLFHQITGFISKTLWLVPLIIFFALNRTRLRNEFSRGLGSRQVYQGGVYLNT